MRFLYQIGIQIVSLLLPISSLFSSKMKLFIKGRKQSFPTLKEKINPNKKYVWFHVASLGEYEQGLPVMEALKKEQPELGIVLTFFSPSGYEIRKNNTIADVTLYLPLDTKANAKRFLDLVIPVQAFFIKYEFWPNYLTELKKRKIPTFLISGIFRENQLFFKSYGGFYREALKTFTHFFVQNETSKQLLQQLYFNNVTVNGDTRFDRVAQILEKDNQLDFIKTFKNNTKTIVIGSSWPQDEAFLIPYINENTQNVKFIIAPHNIKEEQINNIKNQLKKSVVLFSDKEGKNLADFDVFIIDTIGILTKIYSYAEIAYVGGGFGTGIHNILEPATFGVPIIIGPKYQKFQEAKDLVALGSCLVVHNQEDLNNTFNLLIEDENIRKEKGNLSQQFVLKNKNATQVIMQYLKTSL